METGSSMQNDACESSQGEFVRRGETLSECTYKENVVDG